MYATTAAGPVHRTTVFPPRIEALLREHTGHEVFRLDPGTVGVAGPELIDGILRCRPANEHERPTFKPLQGRSITRPEASAVMRAVSQDVRAALRKPVDGGVDLAGEWPHVGHVYLRDLVFGADPYRLRVLVDRRLELTPKLTWSVIGTGAAFGAGAAGSASHLAGMVAEAGTYGGRRHAMGMYRRAAAPVCFTVSALVTGALWLGSPFPEDVSNREIIWETLRLLPPSWNLLRVASPEFHEVDARIGADDDVLMLPLLTHRDPAVWDEPEVFRPERWRDLDPENQAGYLPFGHANERCWGRHMVMPLAERLLELLRDGGYAVRPEQTTAKVPLAGLMSATGVAVTAR